MTSKSKLLAAAIAAAMLSSMAALPAKASNAVEWLKAKQVKEACMDGKGRWDESGVIQRDLNADGKRDLILFTQRIMCEQNAQPFTCGMQECQAVVYFREGDLMAEKASFNTVDLKVGGGDNPFLHLVAHGGAPKMVRYRATEDRFR